MYIHFASILFTNPPAIVVPLMYLSLLLDSTHLQLFVGLMI